MNDQMFKDRDLMEIILVSLGVLSEDLEVERGPRDPKEIDEIIAKIKEWQ